MGHAMGHGAGHGAARGRGLVWCGHCADCGVVRCAGFGESVVLVVTSEWCTFTPRKPAFRSHHPPSNHRHLVYIGKMK